MALPNLISLNSVELTDQGRTFSQSRDERSTSVQLASGLIKKYFMAVKYSFSLTWTMLPNTSNKTYDQKGARDDIKSLAETEDVLSLIVRSPIGNSATYNVWVENYSEDIIRRDYVSNTIFYEVKLDLKEQ